MMIMRLFMAVAVVAMLACGASAAHAQATTPPPPPLGPPDKRADVPQIANSILTLVVKGEINRIVAGVNQELSGTGQSVSLTSLRIFKPRKIATQYTNRQNEWRVRIPMNAAMNVKIPTYANRKVYIPLDIDVSCDGWYSGSGVVRFFAIPGPPSIEGGNVFETLLTIRDRINNQVKRKFSSLTGFSATVGDQACETIGVVPGGPPVYDDGWIAWDRPVRRLPSPIVPGAEAEISVLKLKRLSARTGRGQILYKPVEDVVLEIHANNVVRQSARLSLSENEEVALSLAPMSVPLARMESLIVLANINQQPLDMPQDSAWQLWSRAANFSPGVHAMKITKVYSVPPAPPRNKPTFLRVDAYELTYIVKYAPPPIGVGGQ